MVLDKLEKVRLVTKMKIRMRRRKISTRLFQMVIVTAVLTAFLYFLFQAGLSRGPPPSPDFSWLTSRNVSLFLRPAEDTVLMTPEDCLSRPEPLRLLAVVTSKPENDEARKVIRRTWGKRLLSYPGVKVVFILGRPRSAEIYNSVEEEADLHRDIVMEDFVDSYQNLTIKTCFMLKWVGAHCDRVKFILKVDDDVFVNHEKLWSALESSHLYSSQVTVTKEDGSKSASSVDYLLMGNVQNSVPIRDPSNRYYLPQKFYPLNIFPKFLSGTSYVMTGSLVPALYKCVLKTPFINLEDVFLTGLCGSTQLGLRLTHNKLFQSHPMLVGGSHTCYFKQSATVHGSTPQHMEEVWARTQDDLLCDTLLFSFMTLISAVLEFLKNLFRL